MLNRIFIRVDGNSTIGLGHLVRCQALAEMLHHKFEVVFYCIEIPESFQNIFRQKRLNVKIVKNNSHFLKVLSGKELVILDLYEISISFQKEIKEKGSLLVCVDDTHDKKYFADAIINHAPGVGPNHYRSQIFTLYGLGLSYVLLRPSFLKAALEKKNAGNSKSGGIFICFGGSDPSNITKRALKVLIEINFSERIIVVIGNSYKYYSDLSSYINNQDRENIYLYRNLDADRLITVMNLCAYAIVPSSGILLEVLAVGLKPISGIAAVNQKVMYQNFKAINSFIDAGKFTHDSLKDAFKSLDDKVIDSSVLIDGKSGGRIVRLFTALLMGSEILMRPATEEDLEITFIWASDPNVRFYSFSNKKIGREEHNQWFMKKITDTNCYYFIAELNERCIGSIRFDKNAIGEVEVSYLLDPEFHGQGLGVSLLKLGLEQLIKVNIEVSSVVGYVMHDNFASLKVFRKFGFEETVKEGGKIKFEKRIE